MYVCLCGYVYVYLRAGVCSGPAAGPRSDSVRPAHLFRHPSSPFIRHCRSGQAIASEHLRIQQSSRRDGQTVTAELEALQAVTAQLSTVVSVLRASLNGSNGSTASYPHAEVPQSYLATLANMTLYQNCTTRVVSTCSLLQGVTGAFCQTSTYALSANDYQTIDVFCATANTGETRPLVATLDLDANVARCLCYVASAQPSTAITACNLYATECPVINSFATIVQP